MTENNENCRIQGNDQSEKDKYILRIDHEKCGSKVDDETLTVKTFITVQENLGIFTHSTRRSCLLFIINSIFFQKITAISYRFVVECSYQPDTLTVRASFSVPSKSGSLSSEPRNNEDNESDRESRKRHFRMVGKDALLLKKESNFENLSDERIGIGEFIGDVLEVRKQRGLSDIDNTKDNNTVQYDRLVYDVPLPISESNIFFVILR